MSFALHILIASSILTSSWQVFANADCSSSANIKSFYECVLQYEPGYKEANLIQSAAKASRDVISKWPNPQVEVTSISGENAGEKVGGTEVSVSLSVSDLLIKRPALSKSGRIEEKLLTVESEEAAFKAKSQIIKDLYRYRQITDELELVDEALSTFKKIEQQFKSRSARGPEQEITLNLVELAQGEYELQKNHLTVELSEILSKYKGIFGSQFSFKSQWLPQARQNWPAVSNSSGLQATFEFRKLEAEKEKHEAEKSLANAESWPNIEAGPVFERTTEGPTQYNSVGISLTVDVPILNWNSGARRLANINLERANLNYEHALRRMNSDRDLLIAKYITAVESLNRSTSSDALKKKHNYIDKLFRQGLTSGATVIEAHRQISGFTESQHEHEIVALDSLMYIYQLSGKDPSEVIK